GETLTVFGDGRQSRCFCDVRDVVDAIAGLATHPDAPGRVYNIGGTQEISIGQLAQEVLAVTGSRSQVELIPYEDAYAPGFEDMQRRVPNTSRIESLLGWQPRHSLRETLAAVRDDIQEGPRT
ncbi:MAG: GDP-mannose 4,6-dehydratase, partial [Planctomycetes bacterium]|nr:GDP-mannose 4,6-dehydratase [Planctomycetota bacterium]